MNATKLAGRYFHLRFYVPGMLIVGSCTLWLAGGLGARNHWGRLPHDDSNLAVAPFLAVILTVIGISKVTMARLLRLRGEKWLISVALLGVLVDLAGLYAFAHTIAAPQVDDGFILAVPLILTFFVWLPVAIVLVVWRRVSAHTQRRHHG